MKSNRVPVHFSIVGRVAALGIDPVAMAARAGLAPNFAERPGASVETRQFFAAWQAIVDLSGDPLLGLRIGSHATTGALVPAAMIALHSATLGDALTRLARYKRLSCPEEVRLERDERVARMSFRWPRTDSIAPDVINDVAFASVHVIAAKGTGRIVAPRRIELVRTPPDVGPYAAHFGCEVRTGCAVDALVYDVEALDRPFLTGNKSLLAAFIPALDARIAEFEAPDIEARAHAALVTLMNGERPSVANLAVELEMSPRSLQRRLSQAGTSYQDVLDRARLQTARRLLTETVLSPGEIAFLLGFEEVNSFHRAFRRWEGTTPAQWRRGRSSARPAANRAGATMTQHAPG